MNDSQHGVGNAGINVSSVTATVTTTSGLLGWANENAILIGLAFSLISLLVGVFFKVLDNRRAERHHKERLIEEANRNAVAIEALRSELRNQLQLPGQPK
jgi:predicted Kef-type K+ transport protein